MINYYELAHNRRKNPPRDELLNKFSAEEQTTLKERASHWNQYKYLKMRHELVELRREQYTLRDSYQQTMLSQETPAPYFPHEEPVLDVDIEVLPLGVKQTLGAAGYVFRKWEDVIPINFTEKMLEDVSELYWRKKNYQPSAQ